MGRGALVGGVVTLWGACAPPADGPPQSPDDQRRLPAVDELPAHVEPPDLFRSFFDDRRAESAADFTGWRRDELLLLFAHYVYGHPPTFTLTSSDALTGGDAVDLGVVDGPATELTQAAVHFNDDVVVSVSIFLPQDGVNVPLLIAPNKCGNQSLVPDPRVHATTSFLHPDCAAPADTTRGSQAALWPVADIVAAGWALMTYHESDACPDDVLAADAALAALAGDEPSGGALAAWGAMSAALAAMVVDVGIRHDPERIVVFGHSRRGKAALLAAAYEPRISAVIAHQSGRAGAALSRGASGESIDLITRTFPHWFNDTFFQFAEREDRLPIDQHALVALAAPRPVLLVDGAEDDWADPANALASARLADAAWELMGDDGLVEEEDGLPRTDATLVWQSRPGGHSVEQSDWQLFLAFLAAQL